jgi:hypothetical protein
MNDLNQALLLPCNDVQPGFVHGPFRWYFELGQIVAEKDVTPLLYRFWRPFKLTAYGLHRAFVVQA